MSILSPKKLIAAAGLGAALVFAVPAVAQVDETNAQSVPSCSSLSDDHCIRRGGGMGHGYHHHGMGMGHHHHGHHGHHGYHHHHHKG